MRETYFYLISNIIFDLQNHIQIKLYSCKLIYNKINNNKIAYLIDKKITILIKYLLLW